MTKQEQWFALVVEQQQSGSSIVAFCRSKDIKLPTFHYWRKKYRQSKHSDKGFVDITPPALQHTGIRVVYPNGVSIHLPAADLMLLSQLIGLG